jgi:hypothetical protein
MAARVGLILILAVALMLAVEFQDIQRYLRIRSM